MIFIKQLQKNQKKESEFETISIQGICTDSRKIKSDHLFIALKGAQYDGHAFFKKRLL